MSDDLTFFQWPIDKSGYRCVNATDRDPTEAETKTVTARFLTTVRPMKRRAYRYYNPLNREIALFRILQATEPKEHAIIAFANKYGPLGIPARRIVVQGEENSPPDVFGEHVSHWYEAIRQIREYVSVWDLARAKDFRALSRIILWATDGTSVRYRVQRADAGRRRAAVITIASARSKPHEFASIQRGDLVKPVYLLLQSVVNKQLERNDVYCRLLWDESGSRLGLHIVPTTLLGCIWLQFAKAIEGNKQHRQCTHCCEWYEVGHKRGVRSDRLFCTSSCKAAAHRKKQEEAGQLRQNGLPWQEIARRLNTRVETVQRWVAATAP